MQTIQCPRCRHTFLSYAAECPECGLRRPRGSRSSLGLLAAVVTSGVALAAAVMMAMKAAEQCDAAPTQWKSTTKTR